MKNDLCDNLLLKSSQWAQKALQSFLDAEYDQFFVQAGMSLELLGKAYLSGIHPSLIVDKDFDSLLIVCGAIKHSKRTLGSIKTIGAREVVVRISQILPQLKSYEQELGLLADLRNGVVHLGAKISEKLSDTISPFLRATQIILESCDITLNAYFGSYTDIALKLIDESTLKIKRIVTIKLEHARDNYKKNYGELDNKTIQQLSNVIFKTYEFHRYYTVPEDCPACSMPAISSGYCTATYEYPVEAMGNVDFPQPKPTVTLFVDHFLCKMCGLALENIEEIKAAGLQENIVIEDVDEKDFQITDYEAD